ncbi:MAG: HRDC domain-containing protein [Planctomycetota bacterium]
MGRTPAKDKQDRRPWPSVRSPHRQRAHDEAHEDEAPPPAVLEHDLVPGGPIETVSDAAGLAGLIDTLRSAGRFGYDTEFIGEQTFYPRFCLIQVATAERVWLIDVLSEGVDLKPFWELLADPSVEVLCHAGLQDLEPVLRHTGRPVGKVYDTQIAAAFAGLPWPVSLGNLCEELLGADLGKSSKFSRWDRRPLTETQRGYAANDVRYLVRLREVLGEKLDALGHTAKAEAEFRGFNDPSTYRADPLSMKLKAKGAGSMKRREQAVADALLVWRAEVAERRDVPMRVLLDDQTLVDLARSPVADAGAVRKFKGLSWPVKRDYAEALAEVTVAALGGPLPKRRKGYKPLSEAAQARLESAWDAGRAHCEAASISPSIVFTKKELTALVRAAEKGKPVPDLRVTSGWRGALMGEVWGDLLRRGG